MPTQSAKIDYMTKALLSQEMSFQDCDIKRIVEERLKTHSIREIHTMIQKVVRNSILTQLYPASHFKVENHAMGQFFTPCLCSKDCKNSVSLKHSELPSDAIRLPAVQFDDLLQAVPPITANAMKIVHDNIRFEKGIEFHQFNVEQNVPNTLSNAAPSARRNYNWVFFIVSVLIIIIIIIFFVY